jgi:hypothetical protein
MSKSNRPYPIDFQIGVENRDYHYQSQNATVLGLLVIRGFLNIYPDLERTACVVFIRLNRKSFGAMAVVAGECTSRLRLQSSQDCQRHRK